MLDKLIDAHLTLEDAVGEIPSWDKEIVKLDADNKAGLKVKHEIRILRAEFDRLRPKCDEAARAAEKLLALSGISPEQKQGVYLDLCRVFGANKKLDKAEATADRAMAEPGITAQQKQNVYIALCEIYGNNRDVAKAKEIADKAMAAPGITGAETGYLSRPMPGLSPELAVCRGPNDGRQGDGHAGDYPRAEAGGLSCRVRSIFHPSRVRGHRGVPEQRNPDRPR